MKFRPLPLILALLPLFACARNDAQVDVRPAAAAGRASTGVAVAGAAATVAAAGDPRVALAAKLAAKIPGASANPEDLHTTPVPGVYEFTHEGGISYATADGKFIFAGDLFQIPDNGSLRNLSEDHRRELRLKLINAVPESQMLVFGQPSAKHTLTVFTDVDCIWCRRLHSRINDYNKAGIRVRYLFFPRTGPDTESWEKAEQVWCSADRKQALTRAKLGENLTAKTCGETPVAGQYALGRELGINGTPGLVLDTGELVSGYLPPQQLSAYLDDPVGHPLH